VALAGGRFHAEIPVHMLCMDSFALNGSSGLEDVRRIFGPVKKITELGVL